ncbi:MAG: flagellar basal body P-ring formation protein FlgA [Magnetococcales bacterium]|nr:flagellar basal body P-ring formation protein FlgA [Magnetococcales bacterium]
MVRTPLAAFVGLMVVFLTLPAWSQEVTADTINRMVAEKLQSLLVSQGSELRVEEVRYRYALRLPDGPLDCMVETGTLKDNSGQHSVAVALLVNGKTEKRLRMTVDLKLEFQIPVIKQIVQRGQMIGADDVVWQTVSLTRLPPDLVRDDGEILGFAATRRIEPGVALRSSWFERPLAVAQGERVRVLVASEPGLMIEATAVALEKGRVGDVIQLRNPDSQMRYEARISAPGTVQVGTW